MAAQYQYLSSAPRNKFRTMVITYKSNSFCMSHTVKHVSNIVMLHFSENHADADYESINERNVKGK